MRVMFFVCLLNARVKKVNKCLLFCVVRNTVVVVDLKLLYIAILYSKATRVV